MNNENMSAQPSGKGIMGKKKLLIVMIAVSIGVFILLGVAVAIMEGFIQKPDRPSGDVETLDPWLFDETKPENFDIMEYEEYLELDRRIFYNNESNGEKKDIPKNEYYMYGEEFEVACHVIETLISGDVDAYNGYMGRQELKRSWFSQQQVYDIEITPYSEKLIERDNGTKYNECVFVVKYKIHENNGSYRNTVGSDQIRQQYFVINDSSGKVLVMDILEKYYK